MFCQKNNSALFIICAAAMIVISLSASCGGLKKGKTISISNGIITIPGGAYQAEKFSTQKNWAGASVVGEFTAQGGAGNDIRVLVMPMIDFINYTNGRKATFTYDSGQVTAGRIDIQLPRDDQDYALVFDNSFSSFSEKKVDSKIFLNYR